MNKYEKISAWIDLGFIVILVSLGICIGCILSKPSLEEDKLKCKINAMQHNYTIEQIKEVCR